MNIKKFKKNWKNQKSFKIWFSLLIFSFTGLFLYHITSFVPSLYVKDLEHPQKFWQASHYMYYEVTFQSNLFAFLVSLLTVLSIMKKNSIHTHRFKLLTLSTLSIVFLVFWFYLFILRVKSIGYTPILLLTTLIIHAIVPLLYMFVYFYEIKTEKIIMKLNYKKDFLLITIYPVLYFIFAVIIYFAYGGQPEDAIYSFLRIKYQSIIVSVIFSIGIVFFFIILNFCLIKVSNKFSKNN